MNVLFDLEILDYHYFHTERTEAEERDTEEMRNFIGQRISVLKDQIEKEESEKESCCTIFYIVPDTKKYGRVEFNYSAILVSKMKSCFSENDWKYLASKLSDFL